MGWFSYSGVKPFPSHLLGAPVNKDDVDNIISDVSLPLHLKQASASETQR